MQKLTQEEAGRVTAVLRGAADGVATLARLPQSTRDANSVAAAVEAGGFAEVADELAQLAVLEQAYKEWVRAQRNGGGGGADAGPPPDAQLAQQYKAVLGALRRAPGALALLPPAPAAAAAAGGGGAAAALASSSPSLALSFAAASPPLPLEGGLPGTLRALIEVAGRRLVTTRQQAEDAEVEARNKAARIENGEREVALLREELAKQRASRAAQMSELNAALAKVKDDLVAAQRGAEAELREMHGAGAARAAAVHDAHDKGGGNLTAALEKVQAELKTASDAHVDAEANLRKRKARARLEAETLVREYDAAMGAAQAAIDAMRAKFAAETAPLHDLRQYYARVDGELARLAVEAAAAAEKYFHEVTVMNFKKNVCAKKIQKKYKSWKAWKAAREKAAKKGKKG